MNCEECRPLLEALADDELDLVRHVGVEAHVRACPSCARTLAAYSARRVAIRSALPRFTAPAGLRGKISASVRAEARRSGAGRRVAPFPASWVAGLAASVAVCLLAGYSWGSRNARSRAVVGEVFTEHVRSLQEGHLMDVVSTDRHTVRPWFAGKVNFSPPVVDLVDAGYPLAGGRLDAVDGKTAAALVFRRGSHSINLFVWPVQSAPALPGSTSRDGFNARAWRKGDLDFLAISEIPEVDLERFVEEYRRRTD